MLAVLVLAGLLSLDVCDACRVDGTAVLLCTPHASAEEKALAKCAKGLRSKREAERSAALEKLAALTNAHANAPSPRIVEMLARGTQDDSYVVRTRAVELLGPPQHGPAALAALLAALREHEQEMGAGMKERGKLDLRPGNEAQMAKLLEINQRYTLVRAWGGAIVVQLGEFPDDAAVDAILGTTWARHAPRAQRGLLALGSVSAVRGAVTILEGVESSYERRPEALRDADEHTRTLRELHDDLAAFARARDLPAPAWSAAPAAGWTAWLGEHEQRFPTSLPGVRSPAW
jgi:hypothetical protein